MIPIALLGSNYEEGPYLRVSFEVDENFLVLYCKAEDLNLLIVTIAPLPARVI